MARTKSLNKCLTLWMQYETAVKSPFGDLRKLILIPIECFLFKQSGYIGYNQFRSFVECHISHSIGESIYVACTIKFANLLWSPSLIVRLRCGDYDRESLWLRRLRRLRRLSVLRSCWGRRNVSGWLPLGHRPKGYRGYRASWPIRPI